jgi:hypothetical protein
MKVSFGQGEKPRLKVLFMIAPTIKVYRFLIDRLPVSDKPRKTGMDVL